MLERLDAEANGTAIRAIRGGVGGGREADESSGGEAGKQDGSQHG